MLTAGTTLGIWFWHSQRSQTEPALALATGKVTRREFIMTVQATGTVEPQIGAEVRVGSRISGRVIHLHANLRDRVEQGQTIAELEQEELQAAVDQRRLYERPEAMDCSSPVQARYVAALVRQAWLSDLHNGEDLSRFRSARR